MAVTLIIADLQQPAGELTAALFPTDDIDTLLTGWLAQAAALVTGNTSIAATSHNLAAAAYCYYLAYDYKAVLMASEPTDVRVGERSEKYTDDQRKFFIGKAADWYALYKGYEVPAMTGVAPVFFGRVRASTCGA